MRLNLEERTRYEEDCTARMVALAQQGATIGGVGTRLIIEMLTELMTPEQEAEAKERWLDWLAAQLDLAETEIRKRALAFGIIPGNGNGHP